MGTRLHIVLSATVAAVVGVLLSAQLGVSPVAVADGVCNSGTHWDNVRNTCV